MEKIDNYRVSYLDPCGNAHWSTIAVLAYMTRHYDDVIYKTYDEKTRDYGAEIRVSRYDGCREQGFVFSLLYKGHQANFAVFNPCLYDALCLMKDEKVTDHPDGWGDRIWDKHARHNAEYDYESCIICAKRILMDMKRLIEEWMRH